VSIRQKRNAMAVDHVVKLCADFFHKDEIMGARATNDKYVNLRLPRRQEANAVRSTVEDLVKVRLDPSVKPPVFYVVDIARLSPVDVSH
jgi:hypothetical protein